MTQSVLFQSGEGIAEYSRMINKAPNLRHVIVVEETSPAAPDRWLAYGVFLTIGAATDWIAAVARHPKVQYRVRALPVLDRLMEGMLDKAQGMVSVDNA